MFRLQPIFESCPAGGGLEYSLEFPVDGSNDTHQVFMILPEGETRDLEIREGKAVLERTDGPGLWRFSGRCVDKAGATEVFDQIVVDVVIFKESPDQVKQEVAATLRSMKQSVTGGSWTSDTNIGAEANALFLSFKGAEIPEVLRLIANERADQTLLWRCLLLLESFLDRPGARPFHPLIAEVLADVICTNRITPVVTSAYTSFNRILLKPGQKWIYLLRMLVELPHNAAVINRGAYYEIVQELITGTPVDNRPYTLQVAEAICDTDINKATMLARLFGEWRHGPGIAKLLPILEMDPARGTGICAAIQACEYREAIPMLLELLTFAHGGLREILSVLASWKVDSAKPLIHERLVIEPNPMVASELAMALRQFGDQSYREKIEGIKNSSPDQKAKYLESVLKSW